MIRRRPARGPRVVAAALLVVPALLACAAAAAPALRDYRLANGLRVILSPDPHANVADVASWYDAGTRFEPTGSSGVTQLVERMLFAGPATGAGARLRAAVDERGGLASTLGTPDVSSFYTTLPPEGAWQTLPQVPQLFLSCAVLVSQPFARLPSQSEKPTLQLS